MRDTDTANSLEAYKAELTDFFDGLGRKIDGAVKNYEGELAGFFSGLGSVGDIVKRVQAELDRTAATRFSVFEYFNVREETLSDIFADLLDPVGKHGQGDRFLDLFLDEVPSLQSELSRKLGSDFSPSDRRNCKIRREAPTEEKRKRRIDIVLNMPRGRRIGIENKPFAKDLENQVADYLKELEKSDKEARVLYLSGNGKDPDDLSLPKDCAARARCVTVPYRAGGSKSPSVENWIRQCWKECEAERVRWFLKDLLIYVQREPSFQPSDGHSDTEEGQ